MKIYKIDKGGNVKTAEDTSTALNGNTFEKQSSYEVCFKVDLKTGMVKMSMHSSSGNHRGIESEVDGLRNLFASFFPDRVLIKTNDKARPDGAGFGDDPFGGHPPSGGAGSAVLKNTPQEEEIRNTQTT